MNVRQYMRAGSWTGMPCLKSTHCGSLLFLGLSVFLFYRYPLHYYSEDMAEGTAKSIYDFTVKVPGLFLVSFSLFFALRGCWENWTREMKMKSWRDEPEDCIMPMKLNLSGVSLCLFLFPMINIGLCFRNSRESELPVDQNVIYNFFTFFFTSYCLAVSSSWWWKL